MGSFVESEYKERAYEGLDAQHTPRLIVPERYIEKRSEKLQRLAGIALLNAQMKPDTQFDVVWTGDKVTRFLKAEVQPLGTFIEPYGMGRPVNGTDERFLTDPGLLQTFSTSFTYIDRVEDALKNGAGVFKPSDLARRSL